MNELEGFHVIGSTPPCVGHDLFEGVCDDVALALRKLGQAFGFSLEDVNRKIKAFKLLGKERNDKPAKVKSTKLSGHAVQNLSLIHI